MDMQKASGWRAEGVNPFLRPSFSVTIFPGQLITVSPPFWGMAMEGRLNLRRKDREALREEFFRRAGIAFERMFAEGNQDQLVTFIQREGLACALGKELAAFFLEQHVAADREARPSEKQPPCCPKCQKPGERVTKRSAKLPEREVKTEAGKVTVRREQWRCRKCRVVFFSARSKARFGDRRVQSAADRERGAAGGQGGVVSGSQ